MKYKFHTVLRVFEERGFLLLPIGELKPSLYRLFRTASLLSQPKWRRRAARFRRRYLFGAQEARWGRLNPPALRALDREAYQLASLLPDGTFDHLSESLGVSVFGETRAFDHLEFSNWFNGFFQADSDVHNVIHGACAPLYSKANVRSCGALVQWVSDLSVMAKLVLMLREQCEELTGMQNIKAEHVHLKSWQVRGYKAQWWHLDRGEISAIATIAGHPTTEFLLAEDPAPYPDQPIGYDVFVFPDHLNQVVHQCPSDDLLLCGARARKERGASYLWHRAPDSSVERIVLVLKTHRTSVTQTQQ